MKDALSYQVRLLLKFNNISIDPDELEFQIKSHPTYPSLNAVTGVLDHFNIENLALDVPKTTKTLEQLPETFLAQTDIDGQKQFVIVTKTKQNYNVVFGSKQNKTLSTNEFTDLFTGIILVVDKTDSNIDNGKSKLKLITNVLIFVTSIILIILLFNTQTELINNLLFTFTIIGVMISLAIFKQEKGESSILGNAFCSNSTEKKNCNAVLSSRGATIYHDLKLSDISLIYFTGLALSIFLLMISKNTMFIPQIISILALPIILFSLYYQAVILKKWCFLCLGIVAVLCSNAGLSIFFFQFTFNLESLLIVMLSFSFIIPLYLILSSVIKAHDSLSKMKVDYFKFKRNFDLFKTHFDKAKAVDTQITEKNEIIFGNVNSSLNIVIITNPLCGHCKPVHKLLDKIIKSYPESVKVFIRFNVNPKNIENLSVQIASRLLELYTEKGQTKCLKAMHEVYGGSKPNEWLQKWGNCSKPNLYLPLLETQFNWCQENNINFTPEILVNGKPYPKIFDRQDLIHFIENLEEISETNKNNSPFIYAQNA